MLIAQKRKLAASLFFATILALLVPASQVQAQNLGQNSVPRVAEGAKGDRSDRVEALGTDNSQPARVVSSNEERLAALERALDQQNAKLDDLHKVILEQRQTIQLLAGKLGGPTAVPTAPAASAPSAPIQSSTSTEAAKAPVWEDCLKSIHVGPMKSCGDIRLRSESFFGLSNSLANGDNPAVLGNELTMRHRLRVRGRLAMSGAIDNKTGAMGGKFEWGLRLATGSFADNIGTNQTLTDFYNRKPFSLDQIFVSYKPHRVKGLRIQGGKFETPWTSTEMTIDSDLMIEGINESYTYKPKKSRLTELTLVAWQSPFLERNSAFVRNSNGTVNIEQSRRGGRDLALYGGQIRSTFALSPKVALSLSVADLFFSGTQFISPVQVWGSQLQLPVTFTIPASGSTPAQTITTQVSIPRELLVAGNGNLGLTNASNNATNRDGRLSSGFNLVDLLARLEFKQSKRWPVTLLLNFVTNTQTHDVVTAGPGGADLILPNNENNGFWGEIQIGQTKARGDMQFGYAFMRIEKDAVLTPFNMSDITQQSDMRGHRMVFSYAADPRVTFTVTGIITERPNGLLGPFGTTPPGSFNLPTKRLQLDTVIKF